MSDPTGTIASPAGHIERRRGKRPPIAEMIRRGEALEVAGYVVGLPLDANGDDTPRAVEVRRIAAELEKRTGLPVRLVDERYTTAMRAPPLLFRRRPPQSNCPPATVPQRVCLPW